MQTYLERHAQVHGNIGATEFFENQKSALRARVADAEAKLGEFETLLSNRKAREQLGFQQKHFWRNYVTA